MNKINYYKESLKVIETLKDKPKLLMHVCCGPCSTFPLTFLCNHFNLTLYFYNSNIYPTSEYYRRLEELKRYISDHHIDIKIISATYNNKEFNDQIKPYGHLKEGLERCHLCYKLRMDHSYNYAHKNNYDYFTTVMTISRNKNSQILNQIGKQLQEKYPNTKYFFSDFKKDNGNLKGIILSNQANLYRQEYCGCQYSLRDFNKKISIYNKEKQI